MPHADSIGQRLMAQDRRDCGRRPSQHRAAAVATVKEELGAAGLTTDFSTFCSHRAYWRWRRRTKTKQSNLAWQIWRHSAHPEHLPFLIIPPGMMQTRARAVVRTIFPLALALPGGAKATQW